MYLAGNANFSRDSDFVDTFRLIAANVDHMDDAGFARFSQELGALGVMDTSLVTSALRDYRDFAQKFSASEKVSNVFGTINRAIPLMKQFEKLYSESDSFFKLMAVFSEQSKMTNALGKAGLDVLGSGVSSTSAVGIRSALAKNLVDSGLAKRAGSLAVADGPSNLLLTMAAPPIGAPRLRARLPPAPRRQRGRRQRAATRAAGAPAAAREHIPARRGRGDAGGARHRHRHRRARVAGQLLRLG